MNQQTIDQFIKKDSKTKQIENEITKNGNKIERKFVDYNHISKHLICTICREVLDDAQRINCGHTFCKNCIKEWLSKNKLCPICREVYNEMSRDLTAFNIIEDLEVTCVNTRCPWKSQLVNLYEHVKHCCFDLDKMPTYIKTFVQNEDIKILENEEESKISSNNFLNFNPNIGLKARMYQRNKDLIEKVLSHEDNQISKMNKRDSFFDLMTNNN